jgi:putative methyltransferase (TIGR04325 family)
MRNLFFFKKKKHLLQDFIVIDESFQINTNLNTGYSNSIILEKTLNSIIKVKNGEFPYERDSVLFDKIHYNFAFLSALFFVINKSSILNILDFGGSLGTLYFQNKKKIEEITTNYSWNIVEQSHYVYKGKELLEDDYLKFHYSINELQIKPNLVVFSGVLQYLTDYERVIKEILLIKPDYIFVDRTSFVEFDDDIITVQNVPKEIYQAKYINKFFNYDKLLSKFVGYEIIFEFNSFCDSPSSLIKNNKIVEAKWLGFFLRANINN